MKVDDLHPWDVDPEEAVRIQVRLADRVVDTGGPRRPQRIAAADVSYDRRRDLTIAGVALFRLPELQCRERHLASDRIPFPYVPGLLAFREVPVLLRCFRALRHRPDVLLVDGHGVAHPRRFGLACHIGLLLDLATIGCAKSVLVGDHPSLGPAPGDRAPLVHRGRAVGAAVRTRRGCRPVFVSVGHRIGLDRAVETVLDCCRGARIPEPLRRIDLSVGRRRRELLGDRPAGT